jgi:CRP/FNR family cyclic AMP-dependent transcriptional regulator
MSYAHLLKNVSLFAQINDDELDALASDLLVQSFYKNQVLFQQGSITSSLYIVKTGRIQVQVFGRNREITYTGVYGPEQCFGEFSRPAFFRYLEQHPTVAIKLLVAVSRRMRFAEGAVEHPVALNPEQRIAGTLLEIAEHYGVYDGGWVRLGLRITGDDLASLSGVTRDTANVVLNDLKTQKVIQIERSHVVAIEAARLRTQSAEPLKTIASA